MSDFFVSNIIIKNVLEYLEGVGIDVSWLCKICNFPADFSQYTDKYSDAEQLNTLYQLVEEHLGRNDFGFEFVSGSESDYSIAGFIAMKSQTLNHAFQSATRFYQLLSNVNQLSVETNNGLASLITRYSPRVTVHKSMIDGGMLSAYRMINDGLAGQGEIKKVHFNYPQPGDLTAYKRHFSCPVYFQQADNALFVDEALLHLPLNSEDRSIKALLESHAIYLLEQVPKKTHFLDQVEAQIYNHLSQGQCDIHLVAQSMNLSSKTLQRKLAQHQCRFKNLTDLCRQTLAKQYLASGLSLIEITFLLAYSDQSAFTRAFKSWFQCTPTQYRARLPD